jgi:N-acetylglutamate synthase-like GNAT family acetyltransferase
MEVIYKTEHKEIEHISVDLNNLSNEIHKKLRAYDNENIRSYEIIFKKGVKVITCHKLEDINPKLIEMLIITIEG